MEQEESNIFYFKQCGNIKTTGPNTGGFKVDKQKQNVIEMWMETLKQNDDMLN